MQAHAAAMEELRDRLGRFVRDPSVRLLQIVAGGDVRGAVIDLVMGQEFSPSNRSVFVRCETAFTPGRPGWEARVLELHAQHEARREQTGEAKEAMPALPETPSSKAPLAMFATALAQLQQAAPGGSQDVVVVLAPTRIEDPKAWEGSLEPLLADPGLSAVRWIVIESETDATATLVNSLGDEARRYRCEVSGSERLQASKQATEALAGGVGASPVGVTAPPHPGVPAQRPEPPDAAVRRELKTKVLDAALASTQGRHAEAVTLQRQARDLCAIGGLQREAVTMETMLGTYLAMGGSAGPAKESFGRAVEAARTAGRHDQAAIAQYALGGTLLAGGDGRRAMVEYAEGTVAAEHGDQPLLAIEGAHTAGMLAGQLRMEAQAIAFWSRSVKLAERTPVYAPMSSAAEAARSLAALCRKRGLEAKASDLEDKAIGLEQLQAPEKASVSQVPEPTSPPQIPEPSVEPQPTPAPPVQSKPEPTPAPEPTPVFVAPTPIVVQPPSPMPEPVALEPVASPPLDPVQAEEEEGTEHMPIEEIATIHGWSDEDVARLRQATQAVLDEESTSMLTHDELAQLRGETPMLIPAAPAPAPPAARSEPPAATPPSAEPPATDPLAAALAKMAALREVEIEDELDGESRWFSKDELERLRRDSGEGDSD